MSFTTVWYYDASSSEHHKVAPVTQAAQEAVCTVPVGL